jgi:hypothetical protein
MQKRKAPKDCRYEPAYPGLDTILFTDHGGSATVMHSASKRCAKDYPHPMIECGEFLRRTP